ncbi:hypothetical protein [Parendozoicomonas haliclonae]|uniref:Uncharacterized protein n=1 Tax=Parendozoicomonas haliclonae TaxID=1960125 RepID=A0A1X7AE71_9GAMM|nr:hypothetical protein [Parendozoicomonas haliclonae]SMA33479.1 hypothetical protein EHSB41UT_00288 [Parendozoicomonas haliclonae]
MNITDRLPFKLQGIQKGHLYALTEVTLAFFMADKDYFLERVRHPAVNRWVDETTSKITLDEFREILMEIAPTLGWTLDNKNVGHDVAQYLRMVNLPYTKTFGRVKPFITVTWDEPLRTKYPAALKIIEVPAANLIGPKWLIEHIKPSLAKHHCLQKDSVLSEKETDWNDWAFYAL